MKASSERPRFNPEAGGSADGDSGSNSIVIVSQHYPPDRSGNASRVHDTAEHLDDEGWDVTVLSPPPAFPHGNFDPTWKRKESREDGNITVHRLWAWQPLGEDPTFLSRMAYYLLFPLHATLWLLVHLREFDAVITSSPPIFTGFAGFPFGLLDSKSWIVDLRDLWIDASVEFGFIEKGGWGERLARRYQRSVLRTADRVTVTTQVLGERLTALYGLHPEKIVHLPNGVDTSRFKSDGSDVKPVITYTGNLGHAQDLESCVRAMAALDRSDVVFKIVGDGDVKSKLERIAREENLDDRVEFTGLVPREEIPAILNEAMIGLAPLKSNETLEYAVPTKVYEYMACELPVVATGVGEIERLIESAKAGVVADNDPDAIAEQLNELLGDETRRKEMGVRGREHMVEQFDRSSVAKRLDEVLREIA